MRSLAAFLADRRRRTPRYAHRTLSPTPGYSTYTDSALAGVMRPAASGASEGGPLPHAKRQRLEEAVRQEEQRCVCVAGREGGKREVCACMHLYVCEREGARVRERAILTSGHVLHMLVMSPREGDYIGACAGAHADICK